MKNKYVIQVREKKIYSFGFHVEGYVPEFITLGPLPLSNAKKFNTKKEAQEMIEHIKKSKLKMYEKSFWAPHGYDLIAKKLIYKETVE